MIEIRLKFPHIEMYLKAEGKSFSVNKMYNQGYN